MQPPVFEVPTPERKVYDRKYRHLCVFYFMRIGWSNALYRETAEVRYTRSEAQEISLRTRGWYPPFYLSKSRRPALPYEDPAVQAAIQKAMEAIRASIAQFDDVFNATDDSIGEGLGKNGITYYLAYVDTGLRSEQGRLEIFAYTHIEYLEDWEYCGYW